MRWTRRTGACHLRSLMEIQFPEDGGIPIEQVESVESIVRRFKTGAMSYGSISQEAHETLAIAHEPDSRKIQYR